jgi:hypothetical protein
MARKQGPGKVREPRRAARGVARRLVGVALGVAVGAGVLWLGWQAWDRPGTAIPSMGNAHIQLETDPHPPYNSDPPTSGPHLPYLAPWGIHTRPIPRPLQVHNLEDGGVLIQYNCECPDLVEQLAAIVRRYEHGVILAPYPGMKSRIALTAWTRIDTMDEFDERRIVRFINAYRGIDHHVR